MQVVATLSATVLNVENAATRLTGSHFRGYVVWKIHPPASSANVIASWGNWATEKLFPDGPDSTQYGGKGEFFRPITVKGSVKNYLFTFVIAVN